MSEANAPKLHAVDAPPEGEHFEFDDDGQRLRLVIQSRRYRSTMLVAAGMAIFTLTFTFIFVVTQAVPFAFQLFTVGFAALMTFAAVMAFFEYWIGYELLMVTSDRVRLEVRILVPWGRRDIARKSCHNLRVLPSPPSEAAHELLSRSRAAGRVGFESDLATIRFGAQLTDDEAAAICGFLLARCPDLGPRA